MHREASTNHRCFKHFVFYSDLKQFTIPQEKLENALGTKTGDKNTDKKLITEQNSDIGKHIIFECNNSKLLE